MSRIITAVFGLLLLVQAVVPQDADAARPRDRWKLLGQTSVTDKVDHDTIAVTGARGTFRSIRLEVQGQAVQFRDVKIHFANGDTQDVEVRDVIPAGGSSRVIDIEGRDRVIRSLELRYDAQSLRGKRARVRVYGLG